MLQADQISLVYSWKTTRAKECSRAFFSTDGIECNVLMYRGKKIFALSVSVVI
jgi:hypothetical protein